MSQPAMDLTEFERASLRLLERAWLLAQACARARDPRCASSDAGEPDPGNPVHHQNLREMPRPSGRGGIAEAAQAALPCAAVSSILEE